MDLYYRVAVQTRTHDGEDCKDCRQRQLHKSALVKLVRTGQRFGRLDPGCGLTLHDEQKKIHFPIFHDGFVWEPDDFQALVPVGPYVTNAIRNRYRCSGLGIPLVVSSCDVKDKKRFLSSESSFGATLRMGDVNGVPRLELLDPLRITTAEHNGTLKPIARDVSAAIAYVFKDNQESVVANFIRSDSDPIHQGLRVLEPYQPGKIPVVLIHGLLSNSFTWAELVNELLATPGFNERFQIWAFQYSTGQPFLASASQLREQLRSIRSTFDPDGKDSQLSNVVLIGHSMGGLIAKLQVTSSGTDLWRSVANRPVDQVWIPDSIRKNIYEAFFFRPSQDVTRVIFISTPHRGAGSASRLIGRIGSALVRPTERDRACHRLLIQRNPEVFHREFRRRIPTSIDLLEPKSPLLNAVRRLPVSDCVTMHSIIGNRCGNFLLGRSDGVVKVSSAREPRAVSERMVKAIHSKSKDHPEAIEEVRAILQHHWQQSLHRATFDESKRRRCYPPATNLECTHFPGLPTIQDDAFEDEIITNTGLTLGLEL